jgi:putative toxin-antitoxin system antitoxin component (TIGR02293 family)
MNLEGSIVTHIDPSRPAQKPAALEKPKKHRRATAAKDQHRRQPVAAALHAERGFAKSEATHLFERVAATSALPTGKLRAELIPDSSWKRARKLLGPQASQTAARLSHILYIAERVWGNEKDATEWLNSPHPELEGATPVSMLRTEAGGRAIEALLGALEFGFPV